MKPMQLCRLLFYMQEATVEHKQKNKQKNKSEPASGHPCKTPEKIQNRNLVTPLSRRTIAETSE